MGSMLRPPVDYLRLTGRRHFALHSLPDTTTFLLTSPNSESDLV